MIQLNIFFNITRFITIHKIHRIKRLIKDLDFSNTKANLYRVSTFTNIQTIKNTLRWIFREKIKMTLIC